MTETHRPDGTALDVPEPLEEPARALERPLDESARELERSLEEREDLEYWRETLTRLMNVPRRSSPLEAEWWTTMSEATEPDDPRIAQLEARVAELEAQVAERDRRIAALEAFAALVAL